MRRSSFWVAACWGAVCSASHAANLPENSSFEILTEEGVPVGWNPSANAEAMSVDPASAYHGRVGLHLALDGETTSFSVPLATYVRGAVLDRILAFARNGGTVVCTDPTAFTWDVNGERSAPKWQAAAGVELGDARGGTAAAKTAKSALVQIDETPLRFPTPGLALRLKDAAAKPLATFADGSPAAAVRPYGKGRIITFAADPFASTDKSSAFLKLFRSIQQSVGARTVKPGNPSVRTRHRSRRSTYPTSPSCSKASTGTSE